MILLGEVNELKLSPNSVCNGNEGLELTCGDTVTLPRQLREDENAYAKTISKRIRVRFFITEKCAFMLFIFRRASRDVNTYKLWKGQLRYRTNHLVIKCWMRHWDPN